MESTTSTPCFSAASTTGAKAASSLSMSTSEIMPPRVAHLMGQVGFSAVYSPGHAKV